MTSALAPRSGLPGTRTDTSYLPPSDMTFEEWCSAMETLQAMERSVKWWIGDLILFGEDKFNEDASQAFPDAFSGSPYAESTLRAAAWVSAAFPRGTRVDGVTWTHHRVVADLPRDEAVAMLHEAAKINTDPKGGKYVSSRDLIEKVHARKEQLRGRAVTADGACAAEFEPLVWVPQLDEVRPEVRATIEAAAPHGRHRLGWIAGALWSLVWADQQDAFLEGRWRA